MKKRNIFWGVVFILLAILVVVKQLGYFEGVGFWGIIFSIVLIAIIVKSIVNLSFPGILFPLAFLGIIYDKELNIESLTPWPILLTALLGSIGLSLIFKKKRKNKNDNIYSGWNKENFDNVINEEDQNVVNCSVKFASSVKYINSDNFEKANLECKFGALKVYFDNAVLKDGKASINVEASFGGMELFIPRSWNVIQHIESSFGSVEEKNKGTADSNQTVYITGNVSFSGVQIIYI